MRTLSAATTAAMALDVLMPRYLFRFTLNGTAYYVSTGEAFTLGGQSYAHSDVRPGRIDPNERRPNLQVTFSLIYGAGAWVAPLLSASARGAPMAVDMTYFDGSTTALVAADVVTLFDGVIDYVRQTRPDQAVAYCVTPTINAPKERVNPSYGFNFLAKAGTYVFGNQRVIVRRGSS